MAALSRPGGPPVGYLMTIETGVVNPLVSRAVLLHARTHHVPGAGLGTKRTAPEPSSSFHRAGLVMSVLICTETTSIPGARLT